MHIAVCYSCFLGPHKRLAHWWDYTTKILIGHILHFLGVVIGSVELLADTYIYVSITETIQMIIIMHFIPPKIWIWIIKESIASEPKKCARHCGRFICAWLTMFLRSVTKQYSFTGQTSPNIRFKVKGQSIGLFMISG